MPPYLKCSGVLVAVFAPESLPPEHSRSKLSDYRKRFADKWSINFSHSLTI